MRPTSGAAGPPAVASFRPPARSRIGPGKRPLSGPSKGEDENSLSRRELNGFHGLDSLSEARSLHPLQTSTRNASNDHCCSNT